MKSEGGEVNVIYPKRNRDKKKNPNDELDLPNLGRGSVVPQPFLSQPLSQLYETPSSAFPKTSIQHHRLQKPPPTLQIQQTSQRWSHLVGRRPLRRRRRVLSPPLRTLRVQVQLLRDPQGEARRHTQAVVPAVRAAVDGEAVDGEGADEERAGEKKIALFELVDSEGSSRVMRFETARPYRLGNYAATEVRPRRR
ncbi:RNA-binding CRS1 / YhbY (CRM) domain-containing protein [Actinidia rufa]|uniref:RNA-binding CRS1 / YhbY (CRM) domain-containing protein n=1 Tax=Actinidia rufa TaxID=165716 RepID=A0A7J0H768_9ERIC|nr:RNA-binding CRS1 / YhbY (CRM) domain-containing protein [Actinidia rufa]